MENVSYQARELIDEASKRVALDAKGASDRDVQLMCTGVMAERMADVETAVKDLPTQIRSEIQVSFNAVMSSLPCTNKSCPFRSQLSSDRVEPTGKAPGLLSKLPDGVTVYIPKAILVAIGMGILALLQRVRW